MSDRRGGVGGVVVPGDRVGHCTDTQHAGEGTFVRHQRIFAAVCGRLRTTRAQNGAQVTDCALASSPCFVALFGGWVGVVAVPVFCLCVLGVCMCLCVCVCVYVHANVCV